MYLELSEKEKSHLGVHCFSLLLVEQRTQPDFKEKIVFIATGLLFIYIQERFQTCPQHEQYRRTCQVCILLFPDKLVRSESPLRLSGDQGKVRPRVGEKPVACPGTAVLAQQTKHLSPK